MAKSLNALSNSSHKFISTQPKAGRVLSMTSRRVGLDEKAAIYHSREWQIVRKLVVSAFQSRCVECRGKFKSIEVDHVWPIGLRDGNRIFDPTNLQPLCKFHHNVKTNSMDAVGGRQDGVKFDANDRDKRSYTDRELLAQIKEIARDQFNVDVDATLDSWLARWSDKSKKYLEIDDDDRGV